MMVRKSFLAVSIAAILGLSGCATVRDLHTAESVSVQTEDTAVQQLQELRNQQSVTHSDFDVHETGQYVDMNAVATSKHVIPPVFHCAVTLAPVAPMTVLEFAQTVTKICGVPVHVSPDAMEALNASRSRDSQVATQQPPVVSPGGGVPIPAFASGLPSVNGSGSMMGEGTSQGSSQQMINIKYQGELQGLMDVVSARLGVSWKYENDTIQMYYIDSRVFEIDAIPTITDIVSQVKSGTSSQQGVTSVSSGSGGGGSGGSGGSSAMGGTSGSSDSTTVSLKSSIVDDIRATVKTMLTPGVGRMAMSPSSGTLTVTDTPQVLNAIGAYIKSQNATLTKQVLLNVRVLDVKMSAGDNAGINWNSVFKSLSGKIGFNLSGGIQAPANSVTGAISILGTSANKALNQWGGTNLLVSALSTQGKVSVVTSPSVTTLNLQPVPVQVATQTSYLASVGTTLAANVGSATQLTPGIVTTGFSMNLLPYVLDDDGNILLQYSISISQLNSLKTVSSGSVSIQVPEVSDRIFSEKVRLKTGQTLVLSGFEQNSQNGTRNGIGSPKNWLAGGSAAANSEHDVIVIVITPIVMP